MNVERLRRFDRAEAASAADAEARARSQSVLCSWQTAGVERRHSIIGPDGEQIEAAEIGFRPLREEFNEYLLDDGTVIRLKLVVASVNRIEGHTDPLGKQSYVVESSNVMSVSPMEAGEAQ